MRQDTSTIAVNKSSSSLLLEVKESITLKYMSMFHCICSDCEDNCCKHWNIPIDETHYKMLKERMNTTKEDRVKFQASVEYNKNPKSPDQYASLKLRSNGNCSFLSKDGLCTVQRDYGESTLFDSCAFYPRIINIVGERFELSATLSCPEVARQCLLIEDATELAKLKGKVLPQRISNITKYLLAKDPYISNVNVVRYSVFKLLSLQQFHIGVRLFFCVYFANRISSFFYKDTTSFSKDKLVNEVLRIENPGLLNELYKKNYDVELPNVFTMALIQSFLALRIKDSLSTEFGKLVVDCLKTYNNLEDVTDHNSGKSLITCEKLWDGYEKRRSYWESAYGERIEIYFTNYCRNNWIKDPYVNKSDLITYFRMLLVQFNIIRFLFYSHPDLENLKERLSETNIEVPIVTNTLDKIIVKVTYLFTKHVDHNPQFTEDIRKILDESDIKTFASLLSLLKF